MSTFLVVVDALISSSQRRFRDIDDKLKEFEDLLLSASIKGISELSEYSHVPVKQPTQVKATTQQLPVTNEVPTATVELKEYSSVPPSPPPSQPSIDQQPEESLSRNIILEETGDLEVEDLAAMAFQKRKKTPTHPQRPASRPLGSVSLKMELMQELKKKFGTQTKDPIDTND
ncbi:MAG: hypothetical protein ACW97X_02990 [Candidatus Hodarchaeales archaeon]|jgi:hypothetical protein